MSMEAIHYAYFESKLDGVPRVVLAALGLYAGMDNRCFGSAARLARMTGFSERTVWRALKDLQDVGDLVLEGKGGFLHDGSFEANRWLLPNVVISDRKPSLMTECHKPYDRVSQGHMTECHTKGKVKEIKEEQSRQAAPATVEASPQPTEQNNSLPLSSGEAKLKVVPRSEKPVASAVPLPHGPKLRHAWTEWCQHRREKGKPLTPLSITKQVNKLKQVSEADGIDAIERAVSAGWSDIFIDRYLKKGGTRTGPIMPPPTNDAFAEEMAMFRALGQA
jgi:hypothetical protein